MKAPTRRLRIVVLTCALAAVGAAALWWTTNGIGASDAVAPNAEQTRLYLGEMRENLDGHPDRPRYDKVSEQVLVQEGVTACRWLATQPSGDDALFEDELRDRYFEAHAHTGDGWPFQQGRTMLREELLTNAWWRLCPSVADHHRSHRHPTDED